MSFGGTWTIEVASPMGVQKSTGEFTVDGAKITGTQSSPQGSMPIEGTVDGDRATWKGNATAPMPMALEFDVTESGDTFSGTVKAGAFGVFKVKAYR